MNDTRFSVRFGPVADDLEWGAAMAGENYSQFVRRAVRQRVERIRDEGLQTTTNGENTDG